MSNGDSPNGHLPQRLRLKFIYRADFRKSEATLLEEAIKEIKHLELGPHDCILLLSGNGKIMKFVFGFLEHEAVSKAGIAMNKITKVLPSRTYRICDHGTWNPHMLANYAAEIGIELTHLKKLQAHLKAEEAEMAMAATAAP